MGRFVTETTGMLGQKLGVSRLRGMVEGMNVPSRDVGQLSPGKGALPGNRAGVLCCGGRIGR